MESQIARKPSLLTNSVILQYSEGSTTKFEFTGAKDFHFVMMQKRDKILDLLGLSEDDILTSHILFKQVPLPPPLQIRGKCQKMSKEERVLGYTMPCLRRDKALKTLGISEEVLKLETSKNLGALGRSARRRSFVVQAEKSKRSRAYHFCSPSKLFKRQRILAGPEKQKNFTKSSRRKSSCSSTPPRKSKRSRKFCSKSLGCNSAEMNRLKEDLFKAQHNISCIRQRMEGLEGKINKD